MHLKPNISVHENPVSLEQAEALETNYHAVTFPVTNEVLPDQRVRAIVDQQRRAFIEKEE
jgi:hypothetical protein